MSTLANFIQSVEIARRVLEGIETKQYTRTVQGAYFGAIAALDTLHEELLEENITEEKGEDHALE